MAPNGSAVPYEKVNVLMLSWKDVDDPTERKEFQSQLRSLSEEFKAYRFDVEEYEIESDVPYRKLSRRLDEFLHHDQEGALLIIYYGGHGLNNRDSHCIWLRLVETTYPLPRFHLLHGISPHALHPNQRQSGRLGRFGQLGAHKSRGELEHPSEFIP
jgi:hypothetical protein